MIVLNKTWRVRWQQRRGTRELQATPLEFWKFSCVCFRSPEGRRENSPGLQPWERHKQGNRPERASESGLAGNVEICCYEISMPQLLSHIIFGINARQSAALSGRFCFGTPSAGLKPRAILFSPFGRMQNVQTAWRVPSKGQRRGSCRQFPLQRSLANY